MIILIAPAPNWSSLVYYSVPNALGDLKSFISYFLFLRKVSMKIERENQENRCEYKVWNDYESQIIGGAILDKSSRPLMLKEISVQRNRRSKGIGSKLLKKIVSDFQGSEIVAQVFSSRVGWYESHGFEAEENFGRLVKVRREPQ